MYASSAASWTLEGSPELRLLATLLGVTEPEPEAAAAPPRRLPDPLEREILAGLGRGDPEGVRLLYREYADLVRRLVLAPRLRDRDQVLDLLHETFLTAALRGREFRWQGVGFFPWLRSIARRKLQEHQRRRSREAARTVPLEAALPWLAAPGRPEGRLELAERVREVRERLAEAMATLSPRDRRVLELRLLRGSAREPAAAALGVTVPHLDVLLHRALRRLRAAWDHGEGGRP